METQEDEELLRATRPIISFLVLFFIAVYSVSIADLELIYR
jgi:hypothetical protein